MGAWTAVASLDKDDVPVGDNINQDDYTTGNQSISDDGRYVAFSSTAPNVVSAGPSTAIQNVYVRDTLGGTTSAVSDVTCSNATTCPSTNPSISADGRYVAFQSKNDALVSNGGSAHHWEAYVKDLQSGTIVRVSAVSGTPPTPGDADSTNPRISPDGSDVAFTSAATNFVSGTNGHTNVFARGVQSSSTPSLVSISTTSTPGNADSLLPTIPAFTSDGGEVLFESEATNLTSLSDGNSGSSDVFLRTLPSGPTIQVDTYEESGSTHGMDKIANAGSITPDGRYVAFSTPSVKLGYTLPGCDSGGGKCNEDYVKDLSTGTVVLASREADGSPVGSHGPQQNSGADDRPVITANGSYLIHGTYDDRVVGNDSNSVPDLFITDLRTVLDGTTAVQSAAVDVANSDVDGEPVGLAFVDAFGVASADGRYVAFNAGSGGFVASDPTNIDQVYLRYNANPAVPIGQQLGCLRGTDAAHHGGPTGMQGDPCNLANGNFYESFTDATMPNIGVPFAFVRSYNSADGTATSGTPIPMSRGWTSTYNIWLGLGVTWDGDVTLHTSDGQQLGFACPSGTSPCTAGLAFEPDVGVRDGLVRNSNGTYTLTMHDLTTQTFNSTGQITAIADRNGQGLTFSYSSGRMSAINGNGSTWSATLTYSSGRLIEMNLPLSREVDYHYDGSGRLDQVTDLRGNTTEYAYTTTSDGGGIPDLLKTVTDQNGNDVAHNVYGSAGRVTQQTDARGNDMYFDWDPKTQTATFTDARGHDWSYTYSDGALQQVEDPYGDLTIYGYDGDLNGTTTTVCRDGCAGEAHAIGECPAGATCYLTIDVYDSDGNFVEHDADASLGDVETWEYNHPENTLKDFTDGRGLVTRYEYDSDGNLTCTLLPSVPSGTTCSATSQAYKVTYAPDGTTGLPTSMTDPNGSTTSYGYDAMGDLTSLTTDLGNATRYCYDAGGRMTHMIDPRAPGTETCSNLGTHTWDYGYDDANHLTSVEDPVANQTSYGFDPVGNLTSRTDGNTHVVHYDYDEANDLACVIGPDSAATTCGAAPSTSLTSYDYDEDGNMTSRTDAEGRTWDYDYDDADRLTSTTSPRSKAWSYSYWDDGLVHVKTLPSTGTATYGYDAAARLDSIDYSGSATPDASFAYDADGNRTSMTTGSNVTSYQYDTLNEACWIYAGSYSNVCSSPHSGSFTYEYYPGSQLKKVTFPDGAIRGYAYDDDDRLCALRLGSVPSGWSGGMATRYAYDEANDLTTKTEPTANGYVATLTYDLDDRLTAVSNASGGTTLSSYSFGSLDGVGNPASLTALSAGSTATTYYTYDAYDRLTGSCTASGCSGSWLGKTYAYDHVGNRTSMVAHGAANTTTTYRYNDDDQLCWTYVGTSSNTCSSTPSGGTTYTFEDNGNETAAGSTSYAYDLANRMTSATVSGTTTNYTYDGDGNRLQAATTGGSTTNYRWDTNQPLALLATEADGSGSTLRDYAHGQGLDSMTTGAGSTYYDHLDAYGNVANITTSGGATRWTYAYDAFGVATSATSSGGSPPTNVMRFNGQLLDSASSLYDLRARVYDPSLGRFNQADPLGSAHASPLTSPYPYGDNQPLTQPDPSGLCPNLSAACDALGQLYSAAYDTMDFYRAGGPCHGTAVRLIIPGIALDCLRIFPKHNPTETVAWAFVARYVGVTGDPAEILDVYTGLARDEWSQQVCFFALRPDRGRR